MISWLGIGIGVSWLTVNRQVVITRIGIGVSRLTSNKLARCWGNTWRGIGVSCLTMSHRLVISWLGIGIRWLTISRQLIISWLGIGVSCVR